VRESRRSRIGAILILLGLVAIGCRGREDAPAASAPTAAPGERVPFTLLLTGDVRGEIEPCGCEPPNGGLARRVAAVRKYRAEGPVLVLEAGDALAEDVHRLDRERAQLILEAMAATGVGAAAVGEIELAFGLDWLKKSAVAAGVPYLCANLVDAGGKAVFPGRRIVEVGGNRIGVFAVLALHREIPQGLTLTDPLEAARAEVRALRAEGAELVIGLAHGSSQEVNRIAREAGADVIVPAHRRGPSDVNYLQSWVVSAGHEGRLLQVVRFDLRGEGRLVSENVLERLELRRRDLETKIEAGRRQIPELATPAMQEEARALVQRYERELERIRKEEALLDGSSGRRFFAQFVKLDGRDGEDPVFAERVQRLAGKREATAR